MARSRKRKTKHDSSQRAVASSVYRGKTERPFSLFRRGRLKNTLGRFPGLGFNLLAAPSHQPQADSDLRCGFRRHYSGGTAPDFHRSSLTPRTSKYRSGSYIEKNALSSLIFLRRTFTSFILPVEKPVLPQGISENTKGIVTTEKKVLRTTLDAARFGSLPNFSVRTLLSQRYVNKISCLLSSTVFSESLNCESTCKIGVFSRIVTLKICRIEYKL